jgi:hypothetical protein
LKLLEKINVDDIKNTKNQALTREQIADLNIKLDDQVSNLGDKAVENNARVFYTNWMKQINQASQKSEFALSIP